QALPGAPAAAGSYTVIAHFAGNAYYNPADSVAVSFNIIYGVTNLTNKTKVKSGSTLPIELMVTNATGGNVGAANVTVTAVHLVGPNGQQYAVPDAGNSNPGGLFRYDPTTRTYKFNLKTTGLAAGPYKLYFSIGDDPTLHLYSFEVW